MAEAFECDFPASSANLGPAFDAAALAISLRLRVRAQPAPEWSITASGRDAAVCARPEQHLMVEVYRQVAAQAGRKAAPLQLRLHNEIPIGRGFGSSAAARLAGVAMASRFCGLRWDAQKVFETAAELEGHVDNVAACWWGGLVLTLPQGKSGIRWCRVPCQRAWTLLLVIPREPLATEAARAVLPQNYSRGDAVANLQAALLLMHALEHGRGDLLPAALADRFHQPYRAPLCPLLEMVQALVGSLGIGGCALSGAGPGVLIFANSPGDAAIAKLAVQASLARSGLNAEVEMVGIEPFGPGATWQS
ncbi:MAG: homoserine kinase [Terriglobales bacterium]